MPFDRFTMKLSACAAMALAFTFAAQAQNAVSYVATTGSDSNACTASANCRTIAKALTVTNSGGEVVVVDSGSFGPSITISQPVIIYAVGVDATLDATTSGDEVTVNTSGNVTINGLTLRGHSIGTNGVLVTQVSILRLFNMQIQYFLTDGIAFKAVDGQLTLSDSEANNNGNDGLILDASGSKAYVDGSAFDVNTNAGADSGTGKLTIYNSSAHYNAIGFYAHGGSVTLFNDRVVFNTTGLQVSATGRLHFANCLISDNNAAWDVAGGGLLSGSTPGTTLIAPGQTPNKGSLGLPTTLQ